MRARRSPFLSTLPPFNPSSPAEAKLQALMAMLFTDFLNAGRPANPLIATVTAGGVGSGFCNYSLLRLALGGGQAAAQRAGDDLFG
jgi:hypothetical protein